MNNYLFSEVKSSQKTLIYYLVGGDSKTEPTERAWQSISEKQLNTPESSG